MALAEALKEKKIAGAGIDVYMQEPPAKDHPLFKLENTVLTPHLGASTDEAQTAVSVQACEAIVAYLKSGEIRGAVNAGGIKLDLPPDEAPFAKLASRIGALLAGMSDGGYKTITLRASGQRAPKLMNTLLRLATVELLRPHLDTPVNVINVEHLGAEPRDRAAAGASSPEPPVGLVGDIVGVRADGPEGESHRVLGTVYADGLPRVLRIDNFSMDMISLKETMKLLVMNRDQPGVIGIVGTAFGEAGVNIADMVISRALWQRRQGHGPDGHQNRQPAPAALLEKLRSKPNIVRQGTDAAGAKRIGQRRAAGAHEQRTQQSHLFDDRRLQALREESRPQRHLPLLLLRRQDRSPGPQWLGQKLAAENTGRGGQEL